MQACAYLPASQGASLPTTKLESGLAPVLVSELSRNTHARALPMASQEELATAASTGGLRSLSGRGDRSWHPQTLAASAPRSLRALCSDRAHLGEKAEEGASRNRAARRTSSDPAVLLNCPQNIVIVQKKTNS